MVACHVHPILNSEDKRKLMVFYYYCIERKYEKKGRLLLMYSDAMKKVKKLVTSGHLVYLLDTYVMLSLVTIS